MGMFDEIKCLMPLEDNDNDRTFQTKDFECYLKMIVIDKDGTLLPQNSDDHANFTGKFNFYDVDTLVNGKPSPGWYSGSDKVENTWIEYEAEASSGKVISIKKVSP